MATRSNIKASAPTGIAAQADPSIPQTKLMMKLATKYGVDETKMLATLKSTAFRQRDKRHKDGTITPAIEVTNEQMMMLAVVADQHNLNPFTREIYAFPSENGIVAIVSVDGWIRIINERTELDSIEFFYPPEGTDPDEAYIGCTITRKDRAKPIAVREYLKECYRDTAPWNDMPRRMLRHKALIQCARVAFGFAGIFDPDEAERIVSVVEKKTAQLPKTAKPQTREPERIEAPQDEPPAPKPKASTPLSVDQITSLQDKIREEGVSGLELFARFGVESWDQIEANDYHNCLVIIDAIAGGM